jgi:hypothetical protein
MARKFLTPLLVLLSFAGFLIHFRALSFFSVDDAFISFRYAFNLAQGNGLVFNPGERVEGYTNFLWIVLLAPFIKAGVHPLTAARILGVFSSLLLLFAMLLFSFRRCSGPAPVRVLAGLFTAACGGFAAWAAGGLEAVLFTLLVFSGSALATVENARTCRYAAASACLLALSALTRPEGMMISAAVFLYLLARLYRGRVSKKDVLAWAIVLGLILVPYHLWRLQYFGYLFPNTYYVKSGGGWIQRMHGLEYFGRFLRTAGLAALFLPGLLLAPAENRRWILFFLYLCLALSLGVIYVGGDWMPMYRFLIPLLPFLFLLIQESLARLYAFLEKRRGRALSAAVITLLTLLTCLYLLAPGFATRDRSLLGLSDRDHMKTAAGRVDRWTLIGKWLKKTAKKDSVVAAATVGATAYYSELDIIDTFGMTDLHIAHTTMSVSESNRIMGHQKGDGAYVIGRRPDYIFGLNALTPVARDKQFIRKFFGSKTNREIWASPEFHAQYRFHCLPLDGYYVNFFKRAPDAGDGEEKE